MSYGVDSYCAMLADGVRGEAHAEALRRTVTPGSVVLDLGAGTGVFALLAARLGARRVYAIEPNPAVRLLNDLAARNGLGDRIEVIKEGAEEVELPEPVDLLVADLRGRLPLSGDHLVVLAKARDRFLKPGGVLIPVQDDLYCAPVRAPKIAHEILRRPAETHFGFDVVPVVEVLANTPRFESHPACDVVLPGAVWAGIDYAAVDSPHVEGRVSWTVSEEEAGEIHGLLVWFDAVLLEGVGFTTGPHGKDTVYGRALFPLERPLTLAAGDEVSVRLSARLQRDEYAWRWVTTHRTADGSKVTLDQSTFRAEMLHPQDLRRRADDHVASLDAPGEIDRAILNAIAEGLPLRQIAERLAKRFPTRFPRWEEALGQVGELAERYGRSEG